MHVAWGIGCGLGAGAVVGVVLLALTGDAVWTWLAPAVGQLLGLVVAIVLTGRGDGAT